MLSRPLPGPRDSVLTSTMLMRNRYRAIVAADGAEAAVEFAQRAGDIRLVITDLDMPNLDGAKLARTLRRINPELKLLVISGISNPAANRPEFNPEDFADAFLHKPFKPADLLAKVHELLRGPDSNSVTPWRTTGK